MKISTKVTIADIVSLGTGITTVVVCRKKRKKGWVKTILWTLLNSSVAGWTAYTILNINDKSGVGYLEAHKQIGNN